MTTLQAIRNSKPLKKYAYPLALIAIVLITFVVLECIRPLLFF